MEILRAMPLQNPSLNSAHSSVVQAAVPHVLAPSLEPRFVSP